MLSDATAKWLYLRRCPNKSILVQRTSIDDASSYSLHYKGIEDQNLASLLVIFRELCVTCTKQEQLK